MIISRIEQLSLLLSDMLRLLVSGKANKIGDIRHFCIIGTAKLGDMIFLTPIFRAIKEKYPDIKITVVGNKTNKEVLADNKDVDYYIVTESDYKLLIEKLRNENIDYACISDPSFNNLSFLFSAGIKAIVAPILYYTYCPQQTWVYKLLSLFCLRVMMNGKNYLTREYLRLIEPLNIKTDDTSKHLGFSAEAVKIIDKFFSDNNIQTDKDLLVGILPSAGNKLKSWGGEKFAKLAEMIRNKYNAKIIILGHGEDEAPINEMMVKINNDKSIINTLNQFAIDELKAIISKLNIVIGPDTGPLFIAEAFDVPTIDILGPVSEFFPPSNNSRHRIAKGTAPCYPCNTIGETARTCINKDDPMACFNTISSESVFEIFNDMVQAGVIRRGN